MSTIHQVGIRSETMQPGSDLLQILAHLLPVTFSSVGGNQGIAQIFPETDLLPGQTIGGTLPRLYVPNQNQGPRHEPAQVKVQFADDPEVPFPFRGRCLDIKLAIAPGGMSLRSGEKTLAGTETHPLWVVSGEGPMKCFRTSLYLPHIPAEGCLRDVLNGDRFLQILPLLHFLHEVCGSAQYQGPPLRACFMIDDPNLHWPRYGHVDFGNIAIEAARENYHVSFATIPLDAWFTHGPTAEIFRRNPERLSLLVHGNNHTYKELSKDYSPAQRKALLKQALRRIQRLESAAGVKVSRVMAPPHGACSDAMLQDLSESGFEAATISHGSLRSFNKGKSWTRYVGYLPSELIQGCPVLPRWGLSGNMENTILLAAYLRQPVILMGHHADLRGGLDIFNQPARFINGLGKVLWSNMTELARINSATRLEEGTLKVKPMGKKLTLHFPENIAQVQIENPDHDAWRNWRISGGNGITLSTTGGIPVALPKALNRTISLETAAEPRDPGVNGTHPGGPWPLVRRLLTEGRDRWLAS